MSDLFTHGKKIHAAVLLIFLLSGLFAQETGSGFYSVVPELQHTFVVAQSDPVTSLDPHASTYSSDNHVLSALFEGLFNYNPFSLEPMPALAESYKVSRNRRKWTFTIRKDALFSDGTPITAEAVRQSLLRSVSPEQRSDFASFLDSVRGVKEYRTGAATADEVAITTENDTLVIRLSQPMEYLPTVLCMPAFAVYKEEGVYSGPFNLKSADEESVVLERSETYWDKNRVYLPEVKVIFSEDDILNTQMFNAGEIDWADGYIVETSKLYDQDSFSISGIFGTSFLYFRNRQPLLQNPDVRNALLYAFPWDEIHALYNIPANTLMRPLSGYPDILGVGDTDLEEARWLLKDAGVSGEDITVTFVVPNYSSTLKIAAMIKKAWKKIGVTLNIVPVAPATYYSEGIATEGDLYLYNWIGDFADPISFLELFRGGTTLTNSLWQNDDYDRLLEESASVTSREKRYEMLSQAEQILLDSGEILPLDYSIVFDCIDLNQIGGWYPNSLDFHPFKYLFFFKPDTSAQGWI
ncbi:MAG: peptide ABC transporter substrate-binding protein [Treponemataceae bacterium]|nr:peptide ABC transporter substrate-binding protein [Treponemataceae bacterium]